MYINAFLLAVRAASSTLGANALQEMDKAHTEA